jgi:hypothetical protein
VLNTEQIFLYLLVYLLPTMIALSLDDGSHSIASHEMWKLEGHVEMVQYLSATTCWSFVISYVIEF